MKPVKPPFTYRSVHLASGVQLRWMIYRRCLSSSSPRSPRYPKIYESQTTAHSITDDVCPPTDRNLLEGTVTKNIESFERWLTMKPLAQHTVDAFQIALEFHQNHQQGYGQEKAIILDRYVGRLFHMLSLLFNEPEVADFFITLCWPLSVKWLRNG